MTFPFANAQTEKEHLKNAIARFIKANNTSDYEAQLEFIPAFVFDSISKKELLKELEHLDAETADLNLVLGPSFKIDTMLTIGSKSYARLRIPQNFKMDMSVNKGKNDLSYAEALTYKSLVEDYGKENVGYKKGEWVFYIKSSRVMYGTKTNGKWSFADLNELSEPYIPKAIRASDDDD